MDSNTCCPRLTAWIVLLGIGSPCEGFRFGVVFDDEAIDCCLQVDDRQEDAVFQSPLCELGEEALDGVSRMPMLA